MNGLPEFTLQRPATVHEAALLLAAGARAVAGGTDLLPNLRRGLEQPARLVDLSRVAGLDAVELRDGALVIGAGVTLARLADDRLVAQHLVALAEAARAVAGPGHRSAATLGGNLCQDTRCVFYNQSEWWRASNAWCLKRGGDTCHVAPQGDRCHAAFSGDLAPALLAAHAEVEIATLLGIRRMPLYDLYRDDGAAHLTLAPGEFVSAVRIAAPVPGRRSGYRKARVRAAMDFPLAGVGAALSLRDGVIEEIGIALSGTNSRPIVLQGIESFVGQRVDDALLAVLAKRVQQQASPMRSTATPSNYRRQVAAVLTQRLVRELAADAAPATHDGSAR
ncbi:MAG TPA: 4-hydroxybenzoyl-CoA reductase subunit beta [Burkholderiaceae bacterium]|nr:4-hydroxybenzoyl-CoA reductase subunit beta [Burkholderiaceae bacterium]